MQPNCPIHKSPFKNGKFGLYCNKPLTKSADGEEVLEWCKEKPGGEAATPQNQPVAEPLDVWGQPAKTPLREPVREPVKEVDWDSIALGKTRSLFIASLIQKRGLEPITKGDVEMLEGWLEYAFTGKVKAFPKAYPTTSEDLTNDEMTRILEETD